MSSKCAILRAVGAALACVGASGAMAFPFESEDGTVSGSFDSTITVGAGFRTESPACDLTIQGANGGCMAPAAGVYDQGDLNYGKGDPFTAYLKGTHELLLKLPSDVTFMARGTWMRDFAATRTSGARSALASMESGDGLVPAARDDMKFTARLLDLWVSKSFDVADRQVRVRLGNQVINWGESLFMGGGINATNSMDVQRLSMPGTQLKEALLPAPMVSAATRLGPGVNIEGYYQFGWNEHYLPPVGSYWSNSNSLGEGNKAFGVTEHDAKDSGQWGLSLHWQPSGTSLDLGLYAMNYHDKLPQLMLDQTTYAQHWYYQEDRKLYGISVNFPLGDWAMGSELSYRPKDAVTVNPATSGCYARQGRCWVDEERWQWSMAGIYALTPSNSGALLDFAGADTGNLLVEVAATHVPGLKDTYDGDPVAAGLWGYGQETDSAAAPVVAGDKTSAGIAFDFSLTYDGSLIPGWQVTPGIYYYQTIGSGRTPNISGAFLKGNKSMNLYVAFASLPSKWQAMINYARFFGGDSPLDNALRDRDYVGLTLSRTF